MVKTMRQVKTEDEAFSAAQIHGLFAPRTQPLEVFAPNLTSDTGSLPYQYVTIPHHLPTNFLSIVSQLLQILHNVGQSA